MIDSNRPLAILTEESEHQLATLRRGLRRTAGFALYVVVAKDLGRAEATRRLRAWSGLSGVPELHFFPEGVDGGRAVDAFLAAKDTEHALTGAVIPDVDALIEMDAGNALAALNMARDVLGEIIAGPLVLLVSPEREGDLARSAADLFDVRTGTVTVEAKLATLGSVLAATMTHDSNRVQASTRPLAELQTEASLLRALALEDDPPFGTLADAWVALGRQFLERGEIGEAREAAKTTQQLAEHVGYTNGVADGVALEALTFEHIGAFDRASELYKNSLPLREKTGNRLAVASTYIQLGNIAFLQKKLDDAKTSYENSISIAVALDDPTTLVSAYLQLGLVALGRGETDNAQSWCERSLAILEKRGDRSWVLGLTYNHLALVAQKRGKLDEAQTWSDKSLAIQEELGNRPDMAESYEMAGSMAEERGELEKAQVLYSKALNLQENLGNRSQMASIARQLGGVAHKRNELDKAQAWYERAITLNDAAPDNRLNAASCYYQLGDLATAQGALDKARSWYERAIVVYEQIGSTSDIVSTYRALVINALDQDNLDEAESWGDKALTLAKKLDDTALAAQLYSAASPIALGREDFAKAQKYSEEALRLAEQVGGRQLMALAYNGFSMLAEARGDPADALDKLVRAASILSDFSHPITSTVPEHLARLTTIQGMPALEESWQRITGKPLPAHVRAYVESHAPPSASALPSNET